MLKKIITLKTCLLCSMLCINQTNSISFYIGPRTSMDMSNITLRGKLSQQISDIKSVITKEKNEGKLANRLSIGGSVEGLAPLGPAVIGLCLDIQKSFRSKELVDTSNQQSKFKIKANSFNIGIYGMAGLNLSFIRLLIFTGAQGQYMQRENTANSSDPIHREWQWSPMLGIGPHIRLGILTLEARYMHPVQTNWFTQGSKSLKERLSFRKTGAGTLSVAAMIRT